jgi:RNA polymerase sigma-70 factor (ECF subfamily)
MYASEKALLSPTVPEVSTAELVEATVREHARFVYQVAYAVLRHPQEAEDAVQETFIRVWKHARELAGILNQRAWLARITWRVASDRRKRRPEIFAAREMRADLPDLPGRGPGAEAELIRAQQAELLERMVAMLPGDIREVFVLSTVEEMTSVEIGEVLRIPESTVRGRLLRARQMLKEKIQAMMERKQNHGVGA